MNGLRGAGKDWHLQQNEVAMEDRLLYRVPEVALILNISRSKVYELFGSGEHHRRQDRREAARQTPAVPHRRVDG
jgi:hypothetical protein